MASQPDATLPRLLVSACLLGLPVRYDGKSAAIADSSVVRLAAVGELWPFCPEVAGGAVGPCDTPRPTAEIVGGDGEAVLDGGARVLTVVGNDVTDAYLCGARTALGEAQAASARVALLKEGSPSCGTHLVYDGSFSRRRVHGRGVTAALLARHGIAVFSEHEIELLATYLASLLQG